MRKYLLPATLVALSFVALPKAHAATRSGWYANAGYGNEHYSTNIQWVNDGHYYTGNTTAAAINVGWRQRTFGFEAGYTDLGKATNSYSFNGGSTNMGGFDATEKITARGFTLGVAGRSYVSDLFYLSGRAGAFFWTVTDNWNDNTYWYGHLNGRESDSSTGWYAGLGLGFDISSHWSISGNANYYRMSKLRHRTFKEPISVDAYTYMATVEYRF